MSLAILPLAITMMVGPQIMSDIILVTHPEPVSVSVPFIAAVGIATAIGVAIALGLASILGSGVELGQSSDNGSAGTVIQLVLVALLIAAAIKNYVRRETVEPPKWLGRLLEADEKRAFKTGLLVILLMPSDIVVMLTVGLNLEQQQGSSFIDALPFIGATMLVAALPLLVYLLFRRRAQRLAPQIREWMNSHAWLVNVIACGIFIVLILS